MFRSPSGLKKLKQQKMDRPHLFWEKLTLETIEEVEEPIHQPQIAHSEKISVNQDQQKMDRPHLSRKRSMLEQIEEVEEPIRQSQIAHSEKISINQDIECPDEFERGAAETQVPTVGLADIQPYQPGTAQRTSRRQESEGTETPLGSLDRTEVSLGDSDQTTDSKRFIRDQWGPEGTMVKILKLIRAGSGPVTVGTLIAREPVLAGYKSIIAATCFTSILKLKQHGFITISKCQNTSEIRDIFLGPRFHQEDVELQ